jgi:hypothetical protein
MNAFLERLVMEEITRFLEDHDLQALYRGYSWGRDSWETGWYSHHLKRDNDINRE